MNFDPSIMEWANLIARWIHVFAGILWVGQTYYFTWLDGQFSSDADKVWMVHSGGFYVVDKQKVPELLPRKLHWFKWEAAVTWLTGMILLMIVYYMGGLLLDRDISRISIGAGIAIGLGTIVVSWVVYDLLVQSPLANSGVLFAVLAFILIVGTAYALSRTLSARAAYMHTGAALGTLMTLNVWMRILPAQRKMVAALQSGQPPDLALGARAKLRSKHNTFVVVPLVFIMLSNHFPVATYGSRYGWEVLGALVLAGWVAAYFIRRS